MGSEAEVGISIKGEQDQSVRDLWHFFRARMHFFFFFECLACIFFCVL